MFATNAESVSGNLIIEDSQKKIFLDFHLYLLFSLRRSKLTLKSAKTKSLKQIKPFCIINKKCARATTIIIIILLFTTNFVISKLECIHKILLY